MNEITQVFPKYLQDDVLSLLSKTNLKGIWENTETLSIIIQNENIHIPYRVYFDEPNENNLTIDESLLLNCLLTRHHNGFVRQKALERIILSDDLLVVPFVVQLLGEYVVEILEIIEKNLREKLVGSTALFILENEDYFKLTRCRVISYWNCYYRSKFPLPYDYVGFKILKRLEKK
jgi:hypothetical protein